MISGDQWCTELISLPQGRSVFVFLFFLLLYDMLFDDQSRGALNSVLFQDTLSLCICICIWICSFSLPDLDVQVVGCTNSFLAQGNCSTGRPSLLKPDFCDVIVTQLMISETKTDCSNGLSNHKKWKEGGPKKRNTEVTTFLCFTDEDVNWEVRANSTLIWLRW